MSPLSDAGPPPAAVPKRSATGRSAGNGKNVARSKDLDAQGDRSSVTLEHFAFAAQVSSSSTCSTAVDISSSEFLSRQCTEIDALAQFAWNESALEDAVREATAACRFSATVADPRRSDFPLIAVSEAFEAMTGFSRAEILGKNCRFLNYGCDIEPSKQQALREACSTGSPFTALLLNRRKSGDLFLNLLDLRGLTVAHNPRTGQELWFLVGIQADVSGLAEADYPEDNLPQLSQVAAGIRERITGHLSTLAVAGALAAEATTPTLTAEAANSWFPLPEPRWKTGHAFVGPGQVPRVSRPLSPLAATPPEEGGPAVISPATESAACATELTEKLQQNLEIVRQQMPQPREQFEEGKEVALAPVASRSVLALAAAFGVTAAIVQLVRLRS